jgi:preprotein translocase subunit SecE
MAQKKHKKRRRDNRSEEQRAQSANDIAQATTAQPEKKSGFLSRSKDKNAENPKAKVAPKGSDGKAAKPSLWKRFVTYCKEVKGEMQRVVWPTRSELLNASLIVIGALVFFGVFIAIIDNVIIIPLDAISSLGVNANG